MSSITFIPYSVLIRSCHHIHLIKPSRAKVKSIFRLSRTVFFWIRLTYTEVISKKCIAREVRGHNFTVKVMLRIDPNNKEQKLRQERYNADLAVIVMPLRLSGNKVLSYLLCSEFCCMQGKSSLESKCYSGGAQVLKCCCGKWLPSLRKTSLN